MKRHKRTKVHQERAEQANPGGEDGANDSKEEGTVTTVVTAGGSAQAGGSSNSNDGDFVRWPNNAVNEVGERVVVAVSGGALANKSASEVDTTAQALLNSITQPLAGNGQSTSVASSVSSFTAPAASTTIDMKALGGASTWNNNDQQQQSAPVTSAAVVALAVPSGVATSSTIDLNSIKWQQTQSHMEGNSGNVASGAHPQAVAIKRSSSVESPGQDEERLTVVEGDDSSQDSLHHHHQQQQQPTGATQTSVS